MNNTELGFSAILASFVALPAIAKLSTQALEWLFSKVRRSRGGPESRDLAGVRMTPRV